MTGTLRTWLMAGLVGWVMMAGMANVGWGQDGQSLAGQWRFRLDEKKAGLKEKWYGTSLGGNTHIRLPGTMDDAGLGPVNTKPPTLAGPRRKHNYAGAAWYQREIEIPANWSGRRIVLFLERCRWVTQVWVDNTYFGSQDSLIAPHIYDLGAKIGAGKHRLTICVDNTLKFNLGKFVSALFGGTPGNMNGIVGRVELISTPPVWLEDVQVYPDVERMTARVKVKIGNATGQEGRGTLRVGTQEVQAEWNEKGGSATVEVDMKGARLWDEFSPNMQELKVSLGQDSRTVRFGMRQFAVRGTQFTLNGRTIFLRGTLECSIWPLTGYPPTETEPWRKIYRTMKSYGLNHIRFHSWTPPEAAFAAADEEGILVQTEGPMANVHAGQSKARDAFIEAEFKRIIDTYGNHPSFCTMTLGNEFDGNRKILTGWVKMLIGRDSRHLYSTASGNRQVDVPQRQWSEMHKGRGIHGPDTQHDLRKVVAGDSRPIVGHEIGQWTFFPDFRTMKKYTGVMELENFELVRQSLQKQGMLDLASKFAEATGKHALLLYKEEIEVLLRTHGYAGFSLLDLHDYPMQGTALIGPLDEFWESKGLITPEAYRRFCNSTVPLLRMPKRTYGSDETFSATAEVAHFGPANLRKAQGMWTIKDESGQEMASGKLAAMDVPTGKLTRLGTFNASLRKVAKPSKLTVTLSLNDFVNDWEIWVYPPLKDVAAPSNVVVMHRWDAATKKALAEGKRVVLFVKQPKAAMALPGRFLPVFWSPVWFATQKPNTMGILCNPTHPLFAQFPTESYSNWQWWDLINHSQAVILDGTGEKFRPIVQVIDNFTRNHKLGNLFEARVGKGRLLVCTIDLPGLSDKSPAARQLLHSIYSYTASEVFHPAQTLEPGLVGTLLSGK